MAKTVKCEKCEYEWETSSKLIKTTCPSCGNKTINKKLDTFLNKEGDEQNG